MKSPHTIGVVGLWHLGEIYSAGLAELGSTVIGIDTDASVVSNLKNGVPPLTEPKLAELISSNQKTGRLSFSTDFSRLRECDIAWVTPDTPVNDDDEVQMEVVFSLIEAMTPHLKDGVLFVVSSQIPVGTSEKIVALIKELSPEVTFAYAYSPENLRLGDAVACFLNPGRIVVGTDSKEAVATLEEVFKPTGAAIVTMSPESAEMTKHALNAHLAMSISFTNDIADLCEAYGASVEEVIGALKSDPRVGPRAYLFAGLGFSGGTLGRDLKAMLNAAAARAIQLPVIESVFAKNRGRSVVVTSRLQKELGMLPGKTVTLLGVTYKAGTSTLRRSQPLEIEKRLRTEGMATRLYDPLAKPDEVAVVTTSFFSNDPYVAAEGADALLIMTPSKDFQMLDFKKLKGVMAGTLLFDTCNILWNKREEIRSLGLTYICVGQ